MSDIEEGVDALLMDGRIVHVRLVSEGDREALSALYTRASPRSRYLRFFSAGISIDREVQRLVMLGDDHVALVAEHDGLAVGVASYEILSGDQAELAILVDDAWQGDGIGSLLIEHLAAVARRGGIQELVGDVLASNVTMLRTGASLAPGLSASTVMIPRWSASISPPSPTNERSPRPARDRTAEHNSLRPLLAPASVAVIGVSRSQRGVGYEILRAVLASGFTGRTYPVNPHATSIDGLDCYPSVGAIPEHADLAIVAVPAPRVERVIEGVGLHTGAAVVLSSGFGETGPSGVATEERLLALARRHDIRIVGPNCIGVVNTDPWVRLNATFAPDSPMLGHLAVASQSGAVGVAILDSAERTGVGISTFVSLGNKIDVSTNDLLSFWYDDSPRRPSHSMSSHSEIRAASPGSRGRYRPEADLGRQERAVSQRPPSRQLAYGRGGAPDVAVNTLFRQAGVLRMDTLGELLDAARLLTEQPLPAGDRVAIVGNAGGLNILAADAAEAAGLEIVEFSTTLQQRFADLTPHFAGVANPVDLGADAPPATIGRAIRTLGSSGEADALVVTLVATRTNDLPGALVALSEAADDQPHLPIVAVVVGGNSPHTLGRGNVPVYELPEDAVRSLGHACWYARWRREPTAASRLLPGLTVKQPGESSLPHWVTVLVGSLSQLPMP